MATTVMKTWSVIALVVLLLGGIIVYNKVIKSAPESGMPKGGGKGMPAQAMPVTGIILKTQNVNSNIQASGTLLADEEVELKPEVSGRVTILNIREGALVQKGTLLLKMNDAELQAQLRKLQLQKETAARSEERLKKLLAINGIGQQDYDVALTQLNNIISDIQLLQAQIEKTEIRAPFTGKIGLRNISPGAYVQQGMVVTTLIALDRLKVDFFVPEKYSGIVAVNTDVELEVDGFKERFTAKVVAVEPRIEQASRSVKVRAFINNANARLFPGAFAKVNLKVKSDNAIMVPTNLIIPEARGKKVMRYNNGKAEPVMVETGIRTQDDVQITSGVKPGDTIISSSIMFLKPDAEVKLTKTE